MTRKRSIKRILYLGFGLILSAFLIFSAIPFQGEVLADETQKDIIGYSGRPSFSMYITGDNELRGIGDNSLGQLGTGDVSSRPRYQAKRINNINNIVKVSTGTIHVLAIDGEGNTYAWGSNRYGQLGIGREEKVQENLSETKFVSGRDAEYPQMIHLPDNAEAIDIAAGENYSMVLDSNGHVWTFGWNMNGQLGIGEKTSKASVFCEPKQVKGVDGNGYLENIVSIEAAGTAGFALDKEGKVYAWGSNFNGLLGDKSIGRLSAVPVLIKKQDGTAFKNVKQVSAYEKNAMILTQDGTVYGWGDNMYGQAGDGTFMKGDVPVAKIDAPQEVKWFKENGIHVREIKAASFMMFAVDEEGILYAWGRCSSGSMGVGSYENLPEYVKIKKADGQYLTRNEVLYPCDLNFKNGEERILVKEILNIDSARGFIVAQDNIVWSWGHNLYGQAGTTDNDLGDAYTPVQSKLEMSGRYDMEFEKKNYLVGPIITICITIVAIIVLVVWKDLNNKKWAKLELEMIRKSKEDNNNN